MTTSKDGLARMKIGHHNFIGMAMEDLPEVALLRDLQEEMAAARRRKLTCFQKTHSGVTKKTALTTMTTTTTTSTVTPNMTLKELVKFIEIAVASKRVKPMSAMLIEKYRWQLEEDQRYRVARGTKWD
jgi:hypothetical protein